MGSDKSPEVHRTPPRGVPLSRHYAYPYFFSVYQMANRVTKTLQMDFLAKNLNFLKARSLRVNFRAP